jgi:hypothetical protein
MKLQRKLSFSLPEVKWAITNFRRTKYHLFTGPVVHVCAYFFYHSSTLKLLKKFGVRVIEKNLQLPCTAEYWMNLHFANFNFPQSDIRYAPTAFQMQKDAKQLEKRRHVVCHFHRIVA